MSFKHVSSAVCALVETLTLSILVLPEPASSCRRCTIGSGCLEVSAPGESLYVTIYIYFIEGNLEVKLPTIWTDGNAEVIHNSQPLL